ncbi:hypothetical protein NBRC116583_27900 [Arenicella sp. 4NH20-0111]|uniref:PilW family protein n=1 Tax=Arenicella sp. 4NH20-0111 TaxID=3127648 RepID=UPI0031027C1A
MISSEIRHSQHGYTLVELMIGLLISLMVGSVALTFMLSGARTLSNQGAEDTIQENARFALEILASSVRLSGSNTSKDPQTATLSQGVFREAICANKDCNVNNAEHKTGTAGKNAIISATDVAAFEYISNQGKTCTGTDITFEQQVVQVYYIADPEDDGVSSLYCAAYLASLNYVSNTFTGHVASGNAVPLIDGVEMLQVQYGLDSDSDGLIDGYVSYANLDPAPAKVSGLRAIKIGLVFSNTQEEVAGSQNTENKKSRTYTALDGSLTANDAVLRQSVSTTIFLPNIIPNADET